MKHILYVWLTRLLLPLLERLRVFFSAPTMDALEQLRQEVRDMRQSIVGLSTQPTAAAGVAPPATPLHGPDDVALEYLQAGVLHGLFSQWMCHRDVLQQSTLVVACPLTAKAACTLLHPAEVVVVAGTQDWADVLAERRCDTIALVGLDMMRQVLQSEQLPYLLIRACRGELFYFAQPTDGIATQRRSLHKVGFYEIASLSPDGKFDLITTAWSVSGDFVLRGSQPCLSWSSGAWALHRASRFGLPEGMIESHWRSVLGVFNASPLGWTGSPDALSLSLYQSDAGKIEATGYYQKVQAVMQWPLCGSEGHASLVGAYHGPADSAMVLAMIQVNHSGAVVLSIWWHDEQWKCLSSKELPPQAYHITTECVHLPCWLHLTKTQVRVGCGDTELIKVSVTHGLTSLTAGLRIYGNRIAVTDFDCHVGEGHG